MQHKILEKLCCPFDHADLELTVFNSAEETVTDGLLTCSNCRRYYPIISGIPIMTPDEFREEKFELPFLAKWKNELPKELEKFRIKENHLLS